MKLELLAAAAAGIALSTGVSAHAPGNRVKCFGVNSCHAQGACTVTKQQIAAAQEAFPGQYTKSITTSCSGQNKCGAPNHLAWISKDSTKKCFDAKGFIFEKGKIKKS